MPSMIGFWVFCICLFGFAVRRVNMFFALVAMLLPFATLGRSYSFEARNYGMMLGFCGVALLSWQTAATGHKRVLSLLGLSLGIGGALLCHYFAVLIYLPLAGAEALRSLRPRKFDKAIWAAFIVGAVPLVASLAWIMHLTRANQHAVVQVSLQDYLWFYLQVFPSSVIVLPALVLLAAGFIFRDGQEKPMRSLPSDVPAYEVLAATLFLLTPAVAITLALLLPPHIFTTRYALLSIAGFALLPCLLGASRGGRLSAALGPALAVPAFLFFVLSVTDERRPLRNPLEQEPLLVDALKRGAVAVSNPVLYLQLWYYAPNKAKSRLLYLADEQSSLKYAHIDEEYEHFRKFGVPVIPYKDFAVSGKEFFVYYSPGFGWLPEKLLDDGNSVQAMRWDQGKALFLVHVQ